MSFVFKSLDDLIKMNMFKITLMDGKITVEPNPKKEKELKEYSKTLNGLSPLDKEAPLRLEKKQTVKKIKIETPPSSDEDKEKEKQIEGVELKVPCDVCSTVVCRAGMSKHKKSKRCQTLKIKQIEDALEPALIAEESKFQ